MSTKAKSNNTTKTLVVTSDIKSYEKLGYTDGTGYVSFNFPNNYSVWDYECFILLCVTKDEKRVLASIYIPVIKSEGIPNITTQSRDNYACFDAKSYLARVYFESKRFSLKSETQYDGAMLVGKLR